MTNYRLTALLPVVALLLTAGCDNTIIQKPIPDNALNDTDQTGVTDDLVTDDPVTDTDEQVPDGEWPDGEWPDSEWPDGEWPDGEWPDGEWPDGEWPDGEWPDEQWPDNEWPDSDIEGACGSNANCKEQEFCAKPDGTCEAYLAGTCEPRPTEQECMMYSAIITVCGCDGNTYQHPCFANAAGVNIAYNGECGTVTTCTTDQECGDFVAMLCQKATGVCEIGTGVCVMPPNGCDEIYAPVCGCDGNTYGNECSAHASFMNVAYEGECGGEVKFSTLSYYYDASTDEPPLATVTIVNGETTVTFEGADLVSREADTTYVYLRTTFYGPDGGGVVDLQLRLAAGSQLPVTATLDGTNSYAQWTNFYGGGPVELIGNLYGTVTISQYQRNENTITLIEMGGAELTFKEN